MDRELLQRSGLNEDILDMDNWEPVSTQQMSEDYKNTFKRNKNIVYDYFYTNEPVTAIYRKYNIAKSEVYRYVRRVLLLDTNGNPMGFKGLIPRNRISGYNNVDEEYKHHESTKLERTIQEIPELDIFFERELKKYINGKTKSIKNIHRAFLNYLVKNGIRTNEYPFNLQDKGYRNFLSYFRTRKEVYISKRADSTQSLSLNLLKKNVLRPFEQVEIDGHRIDAYFITEITTPTGTTTEAIIERPWLLAAIDRSTRTVLGYHLALKTEYNSEDVLQCVANSLIPTKIHNVKNSQLQLNANGGIPNQHLSKAAYVVYSELYLDNALSHLSNITLSKMVDLLGINLVFGKVAEPTRRPFVERFFKTLESNGFHNLKSTTGSGPEDPLRMNPEDKALRYRIGIDDLKDITYSVIHNYNGESHASLYGNSPLEDMRQKLEMFPVNSLPIKLQNGNEFFTFEKNRVVRSNGSINHINYQGAKYFSSKMNNDSNMTSKTVTIQINIRDLRTLVMYRADGTFYDELYVEAKWRNKAHSLKERKAINKLIREKAFDNLPNSNYLDAYEYYLMTSRNKNKKTITKNAATKIAHRQEKFGSNTKSEPVEKPRKRLKSKHDGVTHDDLYQIMDDYGLKSQN